MKVILLAAGRGTRISKMIKAVPKCTLPVGDTPLIRLTVELFQSVGIKPVVCVGYEYEQVQQALEGLDVKYYYNPFYDVTNSIASLWFARDELDDDLLVMNADVFFSKEILELILSKKHNVVMAADQSRVSTGDYFFATTESNCVKKYGKNLPMQERSCEYVGMAKIAKEFLPMFRERMLELITAQQHQKWWEDILYSFVESGETRIHTVDVDGLFWSEIDYFDDYERILNYIENQEK